ncbi:MAG: 16S rRNA (adenine(1518)-N(6)/adenine(1519)-N(6))-dimethyltransferase, partial [Eubacterium sp.]|nr:16S rRNA (adenine(1518)-N(6)/adenine(1519)-N(6))-dimethyltransferase [Eubacterium sp.]
YTVPKYSVDDEKAFFALIKAAFAQRRKTVVNSVSATLGIPKEKVAEALASLSLDVNIRAEKLTMENFVELSKIL